MDFESEKVEFKSRVKDGLYKEIIAFSNTEGDTVHVVIDNDPMVGATVAAQLQLLKQ